MTDRYSWPQKINLSDLGIFFIPTNSVPMNHRGSRRDRRSKIRLSKNKKHSYPYFRKRDREKP